MKLSAKFCILACVGVNLCIGSKLVLAQSQVGSFNSVVIIGGSVKQNANGSNNNQAINVGGMNQSSTDNFNATVSVGGISQTANGSGVSQTLNAGSMSNSSAASFTTNVNAGKLEQAGRSGERQEMDIGSVTNSNVSGSVNTTVNARQGIKQVGEGEIAIGAVKNSNIGSFNNSITVNKIEGNNIRIGSIVGGGRYDKHGQLENTNAASNESSNGKLEPSKNFTLPKFANSAKKPPLEFEANSVPSSTKTSLKQSSNSNKKSASLKGSRSELINISGLVGTRSFQNVVAKNDSDAMWIVTQLGAELPFAVIEALLQSNGNRLSSGNYGGLDYTVNGCGASGDSVGKKSLGYIFNGISTTDLTCDIHDMLYGTPGISKESADSIFSEMAISLNSLHASKLLPETDDSFLVRTGKNTHVMAYGLLTSIDRTGTMGTVLVDPLIEKIFSQYAYDSGQQTNQYAPEESKITASKLLN